MEELGIKPTVSIVAMVGDVFQKLDMLDKDEKLKKKYPPPKKEYRYIEGKRVKIRSKPLDQSSDASNGLVKFGEETNKTSLEPYESTEVSSDKPDDSKNGVAESCSTKPSELIDPSLVT